MASVLAFDIETIPDVAGLRLLRGADPALSDAEVYAAEIADRAARNKSDFMQDARSSGQLRSKPKFPFLRRPPIGKREAARFAKEQFETLIRYRCANLFYLVLPRDLFRESEIPAGWGALIESDGAMTLARKPTLHENSAQMRLQLLERIAAAGTRVVTARNEVVAIRRAHKLMR
jgi:hypothetical protein